MEGFDQFTLRNPCVGATTGGGLLFASRVVAQAAYRSLIAIERGSEVILNWTAFVILFAANFVVPIGALTRGIFDLNRTA
jgi:hypothetical protein